MILIKLIKKALTQTILQTKCTLNQGNVKPKEIELDSNLIEQFKTIKTPKTL